MIACEWTQLDRNYAKCFRRFELYHGFGSDFAHSRSFAASSPCLRVSAVILRTSNQPNGQRNRSRYAVLRSDQHRLGSGRAVRADVNGQLVRFERAKELDYLKDIALTIDGEKVMVKKATPLTDSQGNIVNDQEGRTIPRFTTIYDAATKRYVKQIGDTNPIPILCHQDHMRPVAVCRVCSVEVYRVDRNGREARGQKLIPACQHPVEEGMIIHTLRSSDTAAAGRVRDSVRVLTELLAADHLRQNSAVTNSVPSPSGRGQGEGDAVNTPDPLTPTLSPGEREPAPNELATLVDRLREQSNSLRSRPLRLENSARSRPRFRQSSDLININHDSCILCEHCMRACDEVKQNFVICRSGKGYTAHIAFDLNNPMGESSCVSCGECMISCPTDALTFKPNRVVMSDWWKEKVDHGSGQEVDALGAADFASAVFVHSRTSFCNGTPAPR